MAKRGRVLRDPSAGSGLLMVEGQQYPFALDGTWKSAVPATTGLAVDVDFDTQGMIREITAIPDGQLAKEQAEIALTAAKEKGAALASNLVEKFGLPALIAEAALIVGWFFLTAVSVQIPLAGKLEFTFWQVLGFLNANNVLEVLERNGHPSTGIYGFLALACLAGPLVHYFWKDKRAVLGGALPLAFMVIVGLMVRSSLQSAMGGDAGSGGLGDMQQQIQEEMSKAISLGMGIYVSALAALYFAGAAVKRFLAGRVA
jgi:hypothetical protein